MNYRRSQLLASTTITTAGTKTVDVNVKDPISRISIILRLTNNGWTPTDHPAKALSSIDLVDGSNVLFSLNGGQCMAMDYFGTGLAPWCELNYDDNGVSRTVYNMSFGRYLHDPELALDPNQFRNLQLQIKHDYSLGGNSPDGAAILIYADLFDEKVPSLAGFLRTKEHYSTDSATGSTIYVDLPTDEVVRMLVPFCWHDNEDPDITLGNLKLTEDHDKKVIIETDVLDYIRTHMGLYHPFGEYICGRTGSSVAYYVTPHKDVVVSVVGNGATIQDVQATWSGGGKKVIDATTDGDFTGSVTGTCPIGGVPLLMGDRNDISDWWDVTRLSSARLKITQGTIGTADTSATVDVVTQQLHRY